MGKSILFKIWKARMSTLTTPIQYSTRNSSQSNETREEEQNRKGSNQIITICRYDSVFRSSRNLYQKTSRAQINYAKDQVTKTWKSVVFLYTNNKPAKKSDHSQ